MSHLMRAIVTPDILIWARERMHLPIDKAELKLGYKQNILKSWESGEKKPTIGQARRLAKKYYIPFAALFLSERPQIPIPLPRDFRRIAGTELGEFNYELLSIIYDASIHHDIAIDIYQQEKRKIPKIKWIYRLTDDVERSGNSLRQLLGIKSGDQAQWRNSRLGFNSWRLAIENLGILLFQHSEIEVEFLRGFSINYPLLPVIVVNRKDSYAGRTFTAIHELVHILLHQDGICDLDSTPGRPPEDQAIEVYCNAVTAACLVPESSLLQHPLVLSHKMQYEWSERQIKELSMHYSVSREMILRRLLTFSKTTKDFYEQKRIEYSHEIQIKDNKKGYVPPPVDILSRLGRPFIKLVLNAYTNNTVTSSEASNYLGIRVKHFPQLIDSVNSD